jgi:hypothetical protein
MLDERPSDKMMRSSLAKKQFRLTNAAEHLIKVLFDSLDNFRLYLYYVFVPASGW